MAFKKETFEEWIVQAESSYNKVSDEYDKARDYYETEQEPSDSPSDKEYVVDDIITDTIDRSVGQIYSGEISPILTGGGELAKPAKELHDDILEANDFKESVLPQNLNYFYCEGLGGFKFLDNPYKISRYGVGFPEIHILMPGQLLLDTNARSGMHEDDVFRIHVTRMRIDEAQERFGRYPSGKKSPLWDEIAESADDYSGMDTREPGFCNMYEIEYIVPTFSTIDKIRVQRDIYWMTKFINRVVQVQKPAKTGYPCFRLIPMIHTPRKNINFGRYPFALYKKLGQRQDLLNVNSSVTLEAVKTSIKNLIWATGLKEDEQTQLKKQAAKTNGFFATQSPQAKIQLLQGNGIDPALLQFDQISRQKVDDIKGSSSQAQQFQSAAAGQLSGKAIGNLQFAGVLPEFAKKVNVEAALKELSTCIFHYIKTKMLGEFSISRSINGKDRSIEFNKSVGEGFEGDEYSVVNDSTDRGRILNDLSELGEFDVKIKVEMNVMQKEEIDMNKALILAQAQKISDKDLLRKLYPEEWRELYDGLIQQGGAMALVAKMAEYGPDFVSLMSNMIDQYAQQYNIKAEKKAS
jgi:hypothetical protein